LSYRRSDNVHLSYPPACIHEAERGFSALALRLHSDMEYSTIDDRRVASWSSHPLQTSSRSALYRKRPSSGWFACALHVPLIIIQYLLRSYSGPPSTTPARDYCKRSWSWLRDRHGCSCLQGHAISELHLGSEEPVIIRKMPRRPESAANASTAALP
jgi:hypothetical protein